MSVITDEEKLLLKQIIPEKYQQNNLIISMGKVIINKKMIEENGKAISYNYLKEFIHVMDNYKNENYISTLLNACKNKRVYTDLACMDTQEKKKKLYQKYQKYI